MLQLAFQALGVGCMAIYLISSIHMRKEFSQDRGYEFGQLLNTTFSPANTYYKAKRL